MRKLLLSLFTLSSLTASANEADWVYEYLHEEPAVIPVECCKEPCFFNLDRIYVEAGILNYYKAANFRFGTFFNVDNVFAGTAIDDRHFMAGPFIDGGFQFSLNDIFPSCDCVYTIHGCAGVQYFRSSRDNDHSIIVEDITAVVFPVINDPTSFVSAAILPGSSYTYDLKRKWQVLAGYLELWNDFSCAFRGAPYYTQLIFRINGGQLKELNDFSFFRPVGTTLFSLSDSIRSNFVDFGGGLKIVTPFWRNIDYYIKGLVFFDMNRVNYDANQYFGTSSPRLDLKRWIYGVKFSGETGFILRANCFDFAIIGGYEYWGNLPQVVYQEVYGFTPDAQLSPATHIESVSMCDYRITGRFGVSF